jgi:hypothetical protein
VAERVLLAICTVPHPVEKDVQDWQAIDNPKTIQTDTGDHIMVDGWFAIIRKPNYVPAERVLLAICTVPHPVEKDVQDRENCEGVSVPVIFRWKGQLIKRNTFPQVPWQAIDNPKTIQTDTGDHIIFWPFALSHIQ